MSPQIAYCCFIVTAHHIAALLSKIVMEICSYTGKQLAYLSLETPGGALKAAAEQGDIGK